MYLYFGQEPELVAGLQVLGLLVVGLLVLGPLVAGLLLPDHWQSKPRGYSLQKENFDLLL